VKVLLWLSLHRDSALYTSLVRHVGLSDKVARTVIRGSTSDKHGEYWQSIC
jgi:hypothetical protein